MDLEEAEARASAAINAAVEAVGPAVTATAVDAMSRERCKEGPTLKFEGRYQTSLSFEVRESEPGGLDTAAAAIEARWRQDGWDVKTKRRSDSPTRELAADDDGFHLNALYFPNPDGGFLGVTAVTPCATPREEG